MTTQTRALPDLDEALDFEPMCEMPNCDARADWWGRLECGCANHFGCDFHVKGDQSRLVPATVVCKRCGYTAPPAVMIRWVRIR